LQRCLEQQNEQVKLAADKRKTFNMPENIEQPETAAQLEPLVGRRLALLIDAMDLLTQIPQGAVGDGGATLKEIQDAEQNGRCVEDDATYHVVQSAWLKLREMMP
jgi:hypothetical protein